MVLLKGQMAGGDNYGGEGIFSSSHLQPSYILHYSVLHKVHHCLTGKLIVSYLGLVILGLIFWCFGKLHPALYLHSKICPYPCRAYSRNGICLLVLLTVEGYWGSMPGYGISGFLTVSCMDCSRACPAVATEVWVTSLISLHKKFANQATRMRGSGFLGS